LNLCRFLYALEQKYNKKPLKFDCTDIYSIVLRMEIQSPQCLCFSSFIFQVEWLAWRSEWHCDHLWWRPKLWKVGRAVGINQSINQFVLSTSATNIHTAPSQTTVPGSHFGNSFGNSPPSLVDLLTGRAIRPPCLCSHTH